MGIPNTHASTAQSTIAKSAALSVIIAMLGSEPKSTIFVIVSATVALMSVITKTPRKLKTAAMRIAAPGLMQRVTTQVAIAFGASVQPLTRMTPKVSTTAMKSRGLAVI